MESANSKASVDTLYRVISQYDGDGCVILRLLEFRVVKKTPCGFWIYDDWQVRKRFVLSNPRKQFASTTKDEAYKSFKARKKRQIRILEGQLQHARVALNLAEQGRTIESTAPLEL